MSIYCYITENKYFYDEDKDTLILGFMSSLNHSWDDECFYTINCNSSTEKGFHDKFEKIKESLKDFYIDLANGDNLNMEYIVDKDDVEILKNYIRTKF